MLVKSEIGGEDSRDAHTFQRLLRANVALPITLILLLCAVYIGQVLYLLRLNQGVSHSDQVIAEITEVQKLMLDAETGLRGFLLNRNELFLEPYSIATRQLPGALDHLKIMVSDNPEQLARLEKVKATFGAWIELAEERLRIVRSGEKVSLERSINGKRIMDTIRGDVLEMLSLEQRLRNERSKSAEETTKAVLFLTFAGGSIVALLLAFLGRRQLFILSSDYEKSLRQQKQQNAALEHQAWLRTGQSELLAYLRGDLTEEQVAHRILLFLHRYLKTDVSSIYGDIHLEDKFVRLAALGADGNEVSSRANVQRGEGFLGKAAETQEVLISSELPAGYLTFSSSLGATPVQHLVVTPFTARGETVAVLELGFLHAPEYFPRTKELLELLKDPVGTILQATYLRTRQKSLLEETQQLNEELQAQQEELRVSNEELEQQAAILKESQARMETQQVELEETNQKLSSQTTLLADKAHELSTASRYKSEFLANMSHELRTPLNSSLILAKLLADNPTGNLTKEQVEFADTIYSAGNDLLTLINDILDLAKVEAGRIELHAETIYLSSLADSLRKIFKPLAEKKNLKLDIMVAPEAPATMLSDRMRLEQILKNLVSNAIKFTERGSVKLEIGGQRGRVHFAVTDTGIGIPEHQQENIFEAFRQADGTTNRKYGGTGLGLSISRELSHLLGGAITVQSRPGEGSRFEFDLPLQLDAKSGSAPRLSPRGTEPVPPVRRAPSAPSPSPKSAFGDDRENFDRARRTVLVVEDEAEFAKALYQLARELDFQCLVAHTAQEGLELARRYLPSAVILDVALPDQTGMAVLDELKEDLKTRHIPVHMISGHDYSQAALEMGAVGYMLKPVKREELTKAFHLLEEKFSQTLKRVLIVEDDPTQRKSIDSLISSSGVKAVHAERGEQALVLLRESKFDCVILDLTLPDMTGFELLEQMSNMQDISFPPVIVYTGRDLSREEENRLRRHSNSIIVKGARSPERLLDEISLFLHQVEADLPPEKRKMIQSLKNRDKLLEGKTILLVDDDARNLFALMHVLEPRGAKVEVARNGREALLALQNLSQVDLVLMDIMMPEMDGYEAIREIRKNPETAKLPVIAVTAKAMSTDYEKCLAAGANDYLAKPLDVNRLLSLLKVWIQRGSKK